MKPPPMLCLGMARTGTASLGKALNMLGIDKVHHGLDFKPEDHEHQWRILNRAADALYPVLPSYTGEPFGRADWDECFGEYGAITDMASFFAMPLIRAYPDAKVILVERDIDRWYESVKLVFEPWQNPWRRRLTCWIMPLTQTVAGLVCEKMAVGWTQSERPEDIMKNARASYIRHYKEIREAVPPEQLLDFQLRDGWEPLCAFLGKEVPEEPFPHVNDSAQYAEHVKQAQKRILKRMLRRLCLPCF